MSAPVPVPPTLVPPVVAAGLPLDAARAAFAWLCRGPGPVGIDGRRIRGLPARAVPVDELRDRLADPHCPATIRDAVWAHLVRRSRAEGSTWTVVCAGMAAPALEQLCQRLCRPLPPAGPKVRHRGPGRSRTGARVEVEAAVLTGFLAELAVTDLRRPRIADRLTEAGYEAGRQALREIRSAPRPRAALFTSTPPPSPARHPDLVLARAVAARALTHAEAVLIGATRLEPIRVADIARTRGHTVAQVRAARVRAERKLSAYLRDPDRTHQPSATPRTAATGSSTAPPADPTQAHPRRHPRPRPGTTARRTIRRGRRPAPGQPRRRTAVDPRQRRS